MNAKAAKLKISRAARKPLWKFCLYVADRTPRSMMGTENLIRFCEKEFPGQYKIEVVDVIVFPKLARLANIVALLTLVRTAPEPVRRVIDDLSNMPRLLVGMVMRLSA